jgi:ABC-type uncharacterized transport system ATPase subunit
MEMFQNYTTTKRRFQEFTEPNKRHTEDGGLPDEVERSIRDKEKQIETLMYALRMSSQVPEEELLKRSTEISHRNLGKEEIRQQIKHLARKRNQNRQLLSAVQFLFEMKSTVIRGEKLPPPDSPFCRVPFS